MINYFFNSIFCSEKDNQVVYTIVIDRNNMMKDKFCDQNDTNIFSLFKIFITP